MSDFSTTAGTIAALEERFKKHGYKTTTYVDVIRVDKNHGNGYISPNVFSTTIDLNNDYAILNNESIPLSTANLVITSPDNMFSTSRSDYNNLTAAKNQVFSGQMTISIDINSFTPFTLEFIRVKPVKI